MDETNEAVNWTSAYLEWIDMGTQSFGPGRGTDETVAQADTEWADAYLEWIDSATAPGLRPGSGVEDNMRKLDVFREAILLTALHTETECMQILRQRLANGDTNVHAVKLAAKALQHAERLLEEERGAWRALNELRAGDRRGSRVGKANVSDGSWTNAVEGVAADVHALASKVVALQVRPRRAVRL